MYVIFEWPLSQGKSICPSHSQKVTEISVSDMFQGCQKCISMNVYLFRLNQKASNSLELNFMFHENEISDGFLC